MCRLLIGSSKALKAYNYNHSLATLLKHLEKQCGGHGNGVSLHRGNALIFSTKGCDLTVEEITHTILSKSVRYDYAIFHTRIASVGGVRDSLCHPYTSGNDALAMNGTLHVLSDIANALNTTDTEVVFNLVKGLPVEQVISVLATLNAVFVGSAEGKPYVVRNGGALEEWSLPKLAKESDFLFASSFPKGTQHVNSLSYSFQYVDGKRKSITDLKVLDNPNVVWNNCFYPYNYDNDDDGFYNSPFLSEHDKKADSEDKAYSCGYEEGFQEGFEMGYKEALSTPQNMRGKQ